MSNNGKEGEKRFKQIMQSRNYLVNDVAKNPAYYDKDIDFILTSPTTGLVKSFEVKWDSKIGKTGNLYLELTNTHSKGGKGWFRFCQADYIAYGDSRNNIFYIIPLLELKNRIDKIPKRMGYCKDDSSGYLVSLKDIEDITQVL